MKATQLSRKQRNALDALACYDDTGLTPLDLSRLIGTSREGAATTASSLVRRGYATRHRDTATHVVYRITTAGRSLSPSAKIAAAVRERLEQAHS